MELLFPTFCLAVNTFSTEPQWKAAKEGAIDTEDVDTGSDPSVRDRPGASIDSPLTCGAPVARK